MSNERRKRFLFRKEHSEVLEEKSKFADGIQEIWKRGNYEKIKEAHNDIVEYLKEKDFDFFSMQYLLTMTYMELLLSEYIESHGEEVKGQIKKLIGGE
jgi:hypothetical protein